MNAPAGPKKQELPLDTREDRTTSFGIWRYALEYLSAATTLAAAEEDLPKVVVVHPDVTYQCACQGLELAFKAYLRAQGSDVEELKKIGHPITKAMDRAFERGLPRLSPEHLATIAIADQMYAAHEFRYIVTGFKEYPGLETLLHGGAAALMAVAPVVSTDTVGDESLVPRMRSDTQKKIGVAIK